MFALFTLALFANVFDKRTYQPFIDSFDAPSPQERELQLQADINAIPLLERRHYCYTRGLALDLIHWFCNHYALSTKESESTNLESDAVYEYLLVPFIADLAHSMVSYKARHHSNEHPGFCNPEDFQNQIEMALTFNNIKRAYDELEMEELEEDFSMPSFHTYHVVALNPPQNDYPPIADPFETGKNMADDTYFAAI